ncbi:MAG: efflux RND transporter periplasmic adaptor subunit [Muribaculaceae bacterium]
MKLKYIFINVFVLASLIGCKSNAGGDVHSENDGHNHEKSKIDVHGKTSESEEIVFTPEKAKRFGVKTQIVNLQPFNEIIKVSGEITPAQGDEYVVVAQSAGVVRFSPTTSLGAVISKGKSLCSISSKNIVGGDANENARISYMAAKREFERVTPLYKDKIVTEREYNMIKQEYEKARIAYSPTTSSGSVATSAITGTITQLLVKDGEYVAIGQPIATVSQNARLVLRADLPDRFFKSVAKITTANFKTAYNEDIISLSALNGRLISSKSLSNATPGYLPIYFEFDNKGNFIPGSFAEVYLIGNTTVNTIAVPVESITEEQGEYFVYVKIDAECYTKRMVELGSSDGKNIQILSGLKAGEDVVIDGAITIKLAANSGKIPEGHSHSH